MADKLNRTDLILVFLASPSGPYETDQIRIMKGLFLLERSGVKQYRSCFKFDAYDYGPFDVGIYTDIEDLKLSGLLNEDEAGWSRRRIFHITDAGLERATAVRKSLGEKTWNKVAEIKLQVTSLGFRDLLRFVYDEHPDFAKKSVARL